MWPIDDDTSEPLEHPDACGCEECRELRHATDADRAYDERHDFTND